MKDLIIINNEKVFKKNKNFYCDNLDLKILPEELNNFYKVQYIVRSSDKKKDQKINLDNVKLSSNIFKFLYSVYKTFKFTDASYLLISITLIFKRLAFLSLLGPIFSPAKTNVVFLEMLERFLPLCISTIFFNSSRE